MLDANDQANLFRSIYADLLSDGNVVSARGMDSIEITDYVMSFPPFVRWINFEDRKFKLDYWKLEMLWYLKGDPTDLSITNYASTWKSCIDESGKINSNYGYYWFRKPPFPFNFVVQQLIHDKLSRRASMPIISHEHLYIDNPDVPCTGYLNFRIRNNQLLCSVHMRSQDAIYGLGNDLPSFSVVQEMVLNMLEPTYPELVMGNLTIHVDSFHFYDKFTYMVEAIAKDDSKFSVIHCPKIYSDLEVRHLLGKPYNSILNGFAFTNWLNEVNRHAAK